MYAPNQFQNTRPPILPIGLLLVSLVIAFFYTFDAFTEYQSKSEEVKTAQAEQEATGKLLEQLDGVKTQAISESAEIEKYIKKFREDTIYKEIFAVVQNSGTVGGVTISPGEVLTSGLNLATISFTLQADNLESILGFLDKVTSEKAEQRFLVKSVSFPFSEIQEGPISAAISLGMYTIK